MPHTAFEDASLAALPPPLERHQRIWLSMLLWCLGLPGVLAMAWYLGQRLQSSLSASQLPQWVMPVMGALQSSVLLATTVFLGAWLAPRVGLKAPMLSTLVQRPGFRLFALQQMWLPGVCGGVVGAAWMITLSQLIPDALAPGDPVQALPLWIKLLYSGVTEELVVRWGVMSVLLFALWRVLQPAGGTPGRRLVWLAIVLAALLGGAMNLPAAMALMGSLTPALLAYVMVNNTMLGLLTGYIYWRHGLAAAIVAHTLALTMSHGLT